MNLPRKGFHIEVPWDEDSSATEPAPKPFFFVLTAGRHAWPLITAHFCAMQLLPGFSDTQSIHNIAISILGPFPEIPL